MKTDKKKQYDLLSPDGITIRGIEKDYFNNDHTVISSRHAGKSSSHGSQSGSTPQRSMQNGS